MVSRRGPRSILCYPKRTSRSRTSWGAGGQERLGMGHIALAWLAYKGISSPTYRFSNFARMDWALTARGKDFCEHDVKYLEEVYIQKKFAEPSWVYTQESVCGSWEAYSVTGGCLDTNLMWWKDGLEGEPMPFRWFPKLACACPSLAVISSYLVPPSLSGNKLGVSARHSKYQSFPTSYDIDLVFFDLSCA